MLCVRCGYGQGLVVVVPVHGLSVVAMGWARLLLRLYVVCLLWVWAALGCC